MNIFWWHVVFSFIVGGLWLMAVSVIAQRFGSRRGGIIGGLPSTVLVALFFIGLDQGTTFAANAAVVTAPAFLVNCYFLLLWAAFIYRGYFLALAGAAIFWFIATGLVVIIDSSSLAINLSIWGIGLASLAVAVPRVFPLRDRKPPKAYFNFNQLLIRTIFAGSIIAFAVIISKYSGTLLGGVFAAFPAVFISSFTILYFAEGPGFVQSFSRPLIISSGVNTVLYTTSVYLLYPRIGIYTGTVVAFMITLAAALFIIPRVLNLLDSQ